MAQRDRFDLSVRLTHRVNMPEFPAARSVRCNTSMKPTTFLANDVVSSTLASVRETHRPRLQNRGEVPERQRRVTVTRSCYG